MVQNLAWKKAAQLQKIGVETVFSSQVACEEEVVAVYAEKYNIDVVDPWNWWEGGSDLHDSSAPWITAEGWHALPDCAPCTKEVLMDVIAGDQHAHKGLGLNLVVRPSPSMDLYKRSLRTRLCLMAAVADCDP
eukprot:g19345.t1